MVFPESYKALTEGLKKGAINWTSKYLHNFYGGNESISGMNPAKNVNCQAVNWILIQHQRYLVSVWKLKDAKRIHFHCTIEWQSRQIINIFY